MFTYMVVAQGPKKVGVQLWSTVFTACMRQNSYWSAAKPDVDRTWFYECFRAVERPDIFSTSD